MKCSRLVSAFLLALLFSGCQGVGGTQMTGKPMADTHTEHNTMNPSNQPVAGEYLLTLKPGVPEDAQTHTNLQRELGGLPIVGLSSIGHRLYLLKVNPDPGLATIQSAVANSRMLSAAQPNQHYGINPPKIQIRP
ncbi:hypothetical protein [Halothiobacillus sp.]|uniref:hypothetical protein n=1 Tax=Halothiobacillus sp. TaxID=1891311 RepID=UPI002631650D|nr:hypothetical protein [Halothiobacillus sp.]